MWPTFVIVTLLTVQSAEIYGENLARDVAAAYYRHANEAEEIGRLDAEHRLEIDTLHDVLERSAAEQGADVLLRYRLAPALQSNRNLRRNRAAAVEAEIDFLDLYERTPGAAHLAVALVRRSGDPEVRGRLLDEIRPLVASGSFPRAYFDQISALAGPRSSAPPVIEPIDGNPAAEALAVSLEAEFHVRLERYGLLASELGAMRGRDQYVRFLLIEVFSRDLDEAARSTYTKEVRALVETVDGPNTRRVLDLLEQIDFVSLNTEAPSLAEIAIGILHHSSELDVMQRTLELIEPIALAGTFDRQRYALLHDRVAEAEGRPQRYGSQDACIDGQRTLHTLEDPARVDEWRAQMGLEPLAQYRSSLIELYGETC